MEHTVGRNVFRDEQLQAFVLTLLLSQRYLLVEYMYIRLLDHRLENT